jgi:hypothetical protein
MAQEAPLVTCHDRWWPRLTLAAGIRRFAAARAGLEPGEGRANGTAHSNIPSARPCATYRLSESCPVDAGTAGLTATRAPAWT